MKHFVAYHNARERGPLNEGNPCLVYTKKYGDKLQGCTIRLIVGSVDDPRTYSLGSVFVVDHVAGSDDKEFVYAASGQNGRMFSRPLPLDGLPWFDNWFKPSAVYSHGVTEIKKGQVVDGLCGLVAALAERTGVAIAGTFVLPEEAHAATAFVEGAVSYNPVLVYERNAKARAACIARYGTTCWICKFDFEATYGDVARNCIHVHHLLPLSMVGKEYVVDAVKDLRPVCPNCHAVLHRRNPPYSIEEVRAFLKSGR